ncbi:WS/DGAT/MGAT family O-acyltransferase [Mycolicibacter sinensis]|uniref:Diacylglycerol O-acyltransferase n=1 Tax=Mycolicibacter sinensis (strain JDM601) TaxID=875328 RepID=A0A1A2Y1B2_MYCSD|nr:wax ester/triacylglycerol synthase family O-acyltransferase [Mycolicibacter sinensis]OBH15938.1 diacylglycerol O-acyltransferase [Mycolicibacter sinensis]OBI30921.1 diacylglycerol O-acyltransferase [Mycolicibacter sinensis]
MEQLTTLDAGFLEAEDSDRRISLAIGGLIVLEGPPPDYATLFATLGARISACRRFGQKLQLHPFDLAPPRWVPDPDFDMAHHLRRVALPRPGGDAELYDFVADQMAHRLDRDRPLWQIWVIEGLRDDRWAMLIKVHHCVGDGIATSHLFTGLCDEGGDVGQGVTSFADHIRGSRETPSGGRSFGLPTVNLNPASWAAELWNISTAISAAAARAARGTVELSAGLLRQGNPSSLNGPMSALRRYSSAKVALADINQICQAFGVTVNDVALAALTEGYRGMLDRRGERPLPETLRTLVPVSTRAGDAIGATDNRVSVMLPYLPVDEESPVRRLKLVHSRLNRTKSTGQRQAGSAFVSAANRLPFPLTAWAVRLLTRLPQQGVTTLATNVPGPSQPLHILGRQVLDVLPVPPIALQLRTGVAMLSYAEHLFFGVLADYDTMPDVDEFARSIEAAVARLVAAAKRRTTVLERAENRRLSLVATG